jgi:uncharacterized membrane protein YhaH (DUF805 family)
MSKILDRILYIAPVGSSRQVSFIDAYRLFWRRWNDFRGRSSRQEYWKLTLDNLAIVLLLTVMDSVLGINGALTDIYELLLIVPALAILVRRLHDSGHTGKWAIVPVVISAFGFLLTIVSTSVAVGVLFLIAAAISLVVDVILLIFVCQRSDPDNAYGACP